jgi:hypothetical protein
MISVWLIVAILKQRGYKQVQTGNANLYVFVNSEQEETFAFEVWQAAVGLKFLIKLSEVQGAAGVTAELKKTDRLLYDMNS